jgi:16S rRNA pseudouridine516 synthase
MRLDKYIASVTDLSRQDVKKAIKAGKVSVAGLAVNNPAKKIAADELVELEGQPLREAKCRYFMLHKPLGYVCSQKDREHTTVFELLDEDNLDKLHIAGRLDIDTTGLVLLTDDGNWSHRITSPKSQCKKTYLLETVEPITNESVKSLERGVQLKNEKNLTLPASVELIDEQSVRLTITEGKYHQVKRMFAAVGNKVDVLHRERIGNIELDEGLLSGEYRKLTLQEITAV